MEQLVDVLRGFSRVVEVMMLFEDSDRVTLESRVGPIFGLVAQNFTEILPTFMTSMSASRYTILS